LGAWRAGCGSQEQGERERAAENVHFCQWHVDQL